MGFHVEQAYAGILNEIFKFPHQITIVKILKNTLTSQCAVKLFGNSLLSAEPTSVLWNNTRITRFGETSDLNFSFMFSISHHLTVYAVLKSHKLELIKYNKTSNYCMEWS